jgi:hypothetical protein
MGEADVYHFDGGSWSQVPASIDNIRAIWGSSSTDVWFGGINGKMVHYDGSWSAPITLGSSDVGGIWGSSSSDVFMVNRGGDIWHYNGSIWVKFSTKPTEAYLGVWGSSSTDLWTVGADSAFKINKVYHGTR